MQVYGQNQTLQNSQIYTITMTVRGETNTWSFTSRYAPTYSTVNLVRGVTVDMLREISDDEVNFNIWRISLEIDNLISEQASNETSTTTPPTDYVKRQACLYRTAYDVAFATLANMATMEGSQEKDLGDLRVIKAVKSPDIAKTLANLEKLALYWWGRLGGAMNTGKSAKPGSAVRAGKTQAWFPNTQIQPGSATQPTFVNTMPQRRNF